MIRTPVQLTEYQAHELKELSRQQGVSMAELIRQAVERLIDQSKSEEAWRRASALVGRYESDLSDIAVRHDEYLAEDFR